MKNFLLGIWSLVLFVMCFAAVVAHVEHHQYWWALAAYTEAVVFGVAVAYELKRT